MKYPYLLFDADNTLFDFDRANQEAFHAVCRQFDIPDSDETFQLFGMTGRQCQTTIAAGKLLMKDRVLVGIDEEAENAHILEAAKKLWGDLNHREY